MQTRSSKLRPRERPLMFAPTWGLALLAAVLAVLVLNNQSERKDRTVTEASRGGKTDYGHNVTSSVEAVEWDYSVPLKSFAQVVARGGSPLVLLNSPGVRWKATQSWTPKYLAQRAPHMESVYQHGRVCFSSLLSSLPFSHSHFHIQALTHHNVDSPSRCTFTRIDNVQ